MLNRVFWLSLMGDCMLDLYQLMVLLFLAWFQWEIVLRKCFSLVFLWSCFITSFNGSCLH